MKEHEDMARGRRANVWRRSMCLLFAGTTTVPDTTAVLTATSTSTKSHTKLEDERKSHDDADDWCRLGAASTFG